MNNAIHVSALSGLIAIGATAASAQDLVTFQLAWLPGGDKAPIYVCIVEGFCADAGLEVEIEQGRGSTEAITKLSTGISDIGQAGLGALMAARATEEVPVSAVMSIYNKGPHAFLTLADSGISSITDIAGKSVATSPFTSSNVYLPLVLADNGLTEADIELTKSDPGTLGPLLMTGQTDAIIAWVTDLTRYENQAAEAGQEIVYLPWSDAGLELYSESLIASDAFLADRPDVARRFIKAYTQSLEFSHENPVKAAEAVTSIVPELATEDVAGSLNDAMALVFNEVTKVDGLGVFTPRKLAATWDRVAASQGLDPASLDLDTLINTSIAN